MTKELNDSISIDKYGRRINYLRLSITDLCNLRCFYCMPDGVVNKLEHSAILRHEESVEVVKTAAQIGINKVRITGGEPLVRRGVVSLVNEINNIDSIKTVVMTTNAIRLKQFASQLKDAGLKRFNISIDSLKKDTFSKVTRGGDLNAVLSGIDEALSLGFPVKINTVLLSNINTDDLFSFVSFVKDRGIGLRFIERMGFDEKTPLFTQNNAVLQLKKHHDMKELPMDPLHPHVKQFTCDGVKVGFISPMTHSFCGGCNKLRLTPEGKLRMCLASEQHIDLRDILRKPHTQKDLINAIASAVKQKPATAPWNAPSEMWKVGG